MKKVKMETKDIGVRDEGSIVVFYAYSDAGRAWMDENIQAESYMHMGPGLCADRRPACSIIEGMRGDGLVVGEI